VYDLSNGSVSSDLGIDCKIMGN